MIIRLNSKKFSPLKVASIITIYVAVAASGFSCTSSVYRGPYELEFQQYRSTSIAASSAPIDTHEVKNIGISSSSKDGTSFELFLRTNISQLGLPSQNILFLLREVVGLSGEIKSTHQLNLFLSSLSSKALSSELLQDPNQKRSAALLVELIFQKFLKSGVVESDVTTLNIVLDTFVKTGSPEKALSLFDPISNSENVGDSVSRSIRPDTITYNIIFNAYAGSVSSGRYNLRKTTNKIFSFLKVMSKTENEYSELDITTMNTVLYFLSESKQPVKAIEFLKSMKGRYNITPDVISYTTVIDALAKEGDAVKAENLVKKMLVQLKQSNGSDEDGNYEKDVQPPPSIRTFNGVLNAWSRCRTDDNAPQRAKSLLTLMLEMSNPDIDKKSTAGSASNSYRIPRPDITSFNTVLNAYSRCGDGFGAERLLDEMLTHHSDLITPDIITYNTVMSAHARSGHSNCHKNVMRIMNKYMTTEEQIVVEPDVYSYTILIDAYSKSYDRDAPHKAQELLDSLKTNILAAKEAGKPIGVVPNTSMYNTVMNSWVKSGEWGSVLRAYDLLTEMIQSCSSSKSSKNDITSSFDKLSESPNNLDDRQKPALAVAVKPNVRSFTIVMDALAKSREEDAPQRAQNLLNYIESSHEHSPQLIIKPNQYTYTCLINAWGRSEQKDKAVEALNVLNHMKEISQSGQNKYAKPNVYTYNAVLNACAYTYGDEKTKETAFRIACQVFDELQRTSKTDSEYKANHVTYGTFLCVCSRLMPADDMTSKRTIVEAIFRKCRREGQVSPFVLRQLREAAPPDLYWALLGEGGIEERLSDVVSSRLGKNDSSGGKSSTNENFISNNEAKTLVKELPISWTKCVSER